MSAEDTEKQDRDYIVMAVQIAHLRRGLRDVENMWNPFKIRSRARKALLASINTEEFYDLSWEERKLLVKTQESVEIIS